ncbi:MAG: bifunctional glutamate N-acetyltransferase/amino-acid acetyltransferase ArgJ [Oscillospiraceae bacterium]|nr:bifunctional glutamate N-acetyltransferase/amino-acid acetyltransferase ArgJ [Oscillospiraceae bacterium]
MNIKQIDGGITVSKGFSTWGLRAGIKPGKTNRDMAMIHTSAPATVAGVFTLNKVKAAPVKWDSSVVKSGEKVGAVVINTGFANACTGEQGLSNARATASLAASLLELKAENVLVASTGVIGGQLPMDAIENGVRQLVPALSTGIEADSLAAEAIMTTDTRPKKIAFEFELGGKVCHMGGMCKGSGMIHPNLGTMLCFIGTDAAIDKALLQKTLSEIADDTFNMVSVDGDTSTNDSVLVMANGLAGNAEITAEGSDYDTFREALYETLKYLSMRIAEDGEGATKLFEVTVNGAATKKDARLLAKSVVTSSLTKAAIYGRDANWGRILCAMGYSSADFDPDMVDISFISENGELVIVKDGIAAGYSEEKATEILSAPKVSALIDVHDGEFSATAWGCDLTHAYVDINADYRS